MAAHERTPLLPPPSAVSRPGPASHADSEVKTETTASFGAPAIAVALFGVFIANADESLVLATHDTIASDFRRLSDGPWLMTGYVLGYCITLPLYGRMSDLYGRKKLLLIAYSLFGVGCLISGTSISFWQTVAGRIIAGTGGSGIATLISVIMTDMAPPRQVNVLRSYVNVTAIAGRCSGGPLGGFLTDTVGWRCSFTGQAPIVLVCFCLAAWQLPSHSLSRPKLQSSLDNSESTSLLRHLDILGTVAFAASTITFLLLLNLGGQKLPWGHPIVLLLAISCLMLSLGFLAIEWHTREPLIPPWLLKTNGVGVFCLVQILLFVSRWATLSNLSPYFTRTENASAAAAAAHIVPTSIGNAMGAVLAGQIITRTCRYKTLSLVSLALAALIYLLIALRWRHGTSTWESLYVLPAGLCHGMLVSTQFMGLTASAPSSQLATSISLFYLSQQIGIIVGVSSAAALLRNNLYKHLVLRLIDCPDKEIIIKGVLRDSRFAFYLPGAIRSIVRSSYLQCFQFIPILSLCVCGLTLPLVVYLRERSLQ